MAGLPGTTGGLGGRGMPTTGYGFENPSKEFFTQENPGQPFFNPSLLTGQWGGGFTPTGMPVTGNPAFMSSLGMNPAQVSAAMRSMLRPNSPISTQIWKRMMNPFSPQAFGNSLLNRLGIGGVAPSNWNLNPNNMGLGQANPFHWNLGSWNPF